MEENDIISTFAAFAIHYVPSFAVFARGVAVLFFSRKKTVASSRFSVNAASSPRYSASVAGVRRWGGHNVIEVYGLIGIGVPVIGVICHRIIEIVMEWRAVRIFGDSSWSWNMLLFRKEKHVRVPGVRTNGGHMV